MTASPNEMSDEELRRQLVKSLSTAQVESVDDNGEAVIEYEADRLLQLITADRKRVALEARIDELKQLEPPDQFTHYIALGKTNYCSMCGFDAIEFKKHINDRIAELQGDDK